MRNRYFALYLGNDRLCGVRAPEAADDQHIKDRAFLEADSPHAMSKDEWRAAVDAASVELEPEESDDAPDPESDMVAMAQKAMDDLAAPLDSDPCCQQEADEQALMAERRELDAMRGEP